MRKLFSAVALAAIVLAEPISAASVQTVTVATKSGAHIYNIELADNDRTREKGLMNRAEMAADHGMLFDLGANRVAYMWMKNTVIPLDMVFIRADGEVASIAKNAEPMSLAIISSGVRVRAVLELNAGQADKIGLKPGDSVQHKMFNGAMPGAPAAK